MDAETERLLERTRQRREMLDQKMGKGPEAVPRKRRSPLTEDLTSNVGDRAGQSEDSPKRQCVRDKESSVKPDTPAIASVRSRLQALSAQRAHWDEKGAENQGEASPVPTPRKSVALSPPPPATSVDPPATGSQRKSRFAQLASNISNWEDDLSHPTIVKEEEKKPRWQPPKATDSCGQSSQDSVPGPSCAGSKSPRKAATGPQSAQTALALPVKAVADENHAEKSTPSEDRKMEGENEKDDQLGKKVNIETLSKEGGQAKEEDEDAEMNKETDSTRTEETTTKRVLKSNLPKKGETAKPQALSTTDQPLSTRLANWEQKISDSKSDAPCTPKTTAAAATPGKMTLKKDSTPAHPVSTAAAAVEEHVQLRPKARRGTEDEPTAHPVSARMSAWEQISTAQVVTNIKKVQPGESTPAKLLPAGQKSPAKNVPGTPGIKERIAQLGTPQKASGGTPGKGVGSSSKSVQWQPAQQSQSSSMAQRLRQERMAELEGIQNRWKNGVLQEGAQGQAQQPPEVESSANLSDKRQGMQEKARAVVDDSSKGETSGIRARDEPDPEHKNERTISTREENLTTKQQVDKDVHSQAKIIEPACSTGMELEELADSQKDTCEITHSAETGSEQPTKEAAELRSQAVESQTPKLEVPQKDSLKTSSSSLGEEMAKQEMMVNRNAEEGKDQEGKIGEDSSPLQAEEEEEPMDCSDEKMTNACSDCSLNTNGTETPKDAAVVEAREQTECGDAAIESSPSYDNGAEIDKTEQGPTQLPQQSEGTCSNFQNKLFTIGLDDASDPAQTKGREETSSKSTTSGNSSGGGIVTGKPPRPTSLFTIVSQQKAEAAATAAASPKTSISSTTSRKACRKVKFDDSFDDEDSHLPLRPRTQLLMPEPVAEEEEGNPEDGGAEDEVEVVLRRPRPSSQQQQKQEEERYDDDDDDDDDVSLSAFVPRSVRFESVARSGQDLDSSLDSLEGAPGAPPDFHKSTVDLVKLGQQYGAYSDSDEDTTHTVGHCAASRHSASQSQSSTHPASTSGDLEESIDDRDAIGDLLDQAMESEGEGEKKEEGGPSTSAQPEEEEEAPVPVMRKKKPREASARGDLPFSINEYRASRNLQIQEVKQTIVRNSQYVGKVIREEDVQMPSPVPSPAPPRSLSDRIKELQELVQQEQSVIMQTSNALNQCCNSSHFAGSSEQVECNRILLLSCQKRQAYLTEIQRLKNSGVLDPSGPGPKGSLTISDIRLPLKKDFVTKIATLQDTMTYYFIVLLRRGAQVISTQMLSTHDPMMSGSLDFPNLIKLNNITDQFQLTLEIYCMSVSCEAAGKDKKKKTPKKMKGLTVQSPGGPLAVRTTSFSQVTTVPLTMKCVDKHSFTLHRLPHLSPLHGTIYMKLKCLMEANVEEKGFLTMFEDVSGLGSWHRRWCVLGASRLQFWKYPDDETRKEPIGSIELKRCVTEKVGLISRDVCARPNTFELTTVRQPQKGEKDTLVTTTHTTVTTVRHMLSADTKEERIVWCNKVNRALATLRTWHADAMRPLAK